MKARRSTFFISSIAIFAFGVCLAQTLQAAQRNWSDTSIGGNTFNLNLPANWGGTLPTNGDNANIVWTSGSNNKTDILTNAPSSVFFADSLNITNASGNSSSDATITFSGQVFLTNGVGSLNFGGSSSGSGDISLTFNSNFNFQAANFVGGAGSSATMTLAGPALGANLLFNGNGGNNDLVVNGTLGLSGTLTATNFNVNSSVRFSGNSTLARLVVNNTAGNGLFLITNSTMSITGNVASVAGGFTLANNATMDLSGAGLILSNIAPTINGTIDVNASTLAASNGWNNGGTVNIAGGLINGSAMTNISGGNLVGYGNVSNAFVNLSGGDIIATNGTLILASSLVQNGTINVADSGTLNVLQVWTNNGTVTMQGGTLAGALMTNAVARNVIGSGILSNSLVNLGLLTATNGELVLTGVISGTGTNMARGGGAGGTLTFANNASISALSNTAGGTIQVITGGAVTNGSAFINNGNLTLAGGIYSSAANVTNTASATVGNYGTLDAGLINLGTLTATGGVLTVTKALVQNGTVNVANGGTLNISQGWNNNGTVNMLGGTLAGSSVTNLAGKTILGSGIASNAVVNSGNLVSSNGQLSLTAGLIQSGTATVLNASTLNVVPNWQNNGLLTANGSVTGGNITNAGTIKGSGTIAGAVTVLAGGRIGAGNSIGTLGTGTLVLNAGSTNDVELGTPGTSHSSPGSSDLINVTGDITLGGLLNLINNAGANGNGSVGAGSYNIFTYTGTQSGNFAATNHITNLHDALVDGGAGTGSGQGVFLDLYRLAAANTVTSPINLGNVHVGDSFGTQALTIQNTAANDGFSEKLNANFGTLTGSASTNNGSISLLGPTAVDNASLVVGLGNANTATAGGKGGTVVVNLNSDGSDTSGWGTTPLTAQTITITGAVYRLASPNTVTTPINLGNIRVGGSFGTQALNVQNTAANDGFSEKLDASFGTITGEASTNNGSINLLGPNATNSASMVVGLGGANTAAAGAKSGTVLLNLTSDGSGTSGLGLTGLAGQTITINGNVYRLAAANTIGGLSFGNYHVGDSVTQQALTLQNTAANDGFSEKLNGKFGTITGGLTTNGSVNLLSAGSTDSSSLLVGLNTATAGAKGGTVVVTLVSDGTGTSGLSASNLTAQTVNVTGGNVYRLAAANTLPTPINLGNIHVGDAFGTQVLVITNTAANDGFSEKLDSSFGTLTGDASTNNGSINLLGPGTRDNTSMVVGLGNASTVTAGSKSGTVSINLTSDGSGTSGLGLTSLAGQTITINGSVYRLAAANAISDVTFSGNHRVGEAVAQQALSLQNTAANDGFSEKLNASFGTITGSLTTNGVVNLLGAGSTDNTHLLVGINTATVGSKSGTVVVNLVSDGSGTSGLGTTGLTPQTIDITAGNVYRLAAANTIGGLVFSGNYHVGDTVAQALIITNTAANDGFSEKLNASFGTITGGLTTNGSVSLLGAGSADNSSLLVGLNTATVGSKSGTVVVKLVSDGTGTSGLSASNLTSQTVNITAGSVYRLASANTVPTPINLGSIHAGGTFGTQSLSITNTAANDGFSEKLTASFGTPAAGITASGSFSLLNPGSRNTSMVLDISDNTAGTKSGTVSLNLTSDGTGTSGLGTTALTPQIITVNGIVYSGQGVWNVNGSGNWIDSTKWTADGGVPGIDGALSISDSAFFGSALTSGGSTISLNGTSPKLSGITFSNASFSYTIAQGSGGSLILSNSPVVTVADGSHTISAPVVLANDTQVTLTDVSDQLTISGVISGGGDLTKTGSGILIFSGANSYGTTTIDGGTLQIGNGGASGSLGSGVVTNNASLVFNRSGDFTVANAIRGSGSFAHYGSGILTLNAANSYSGDTVVSNGTLKAGVANSLSSNSVMVLLGGATLDVDGFSQAVAGLSGNGTITRANPGSPTTFTIVNAGDHNFAGVIDGKVDVVKQGAGTLTLSGTSANTFQNQTTVNEGELDLGKSAGVAAIPNDLIIGDGVGGVNADIVRLLASSQIDNASIVTVNSSGLFDLNGFNEAIGTLNNSGNVVMGGGALAGATLNNALAGTITGPGVFSNTLINAGTLIVTNGTVSVLQGWNNNGTVALRGGILAGSTMTNLATRNITGYGTLSSTIVNNGVVTATNGTLQLAGLGGGTGNYRAGAGASMIFAGNGSLGSLSNEAGSAVQVLGSITNGASFVNQGSFQLLGGTYSSTKAVTNLASSTVGNFGIFDATLVNLGTVSMTNGTMNFTKGIVQGVGGIVNVDNAILNAGQAWTNIAGATVNLYNGTIAGSLFANQGLLFGSGLVSAPFINSGTVTHDGAGITFSSIVTNSGAGTMDLDGGTNNFAGSLVNNGTIVMAGGTINGPKFQNNGSFHGHGNINSEVHNVGIMNLGGGKTTFESVVTNAALFTVTNSIVVFSNNFVNLGTYISDPSTNIYAGDFTLGPNASLIGGAGDVFEFQKNFYNDSTNSTLFDLSLSTVTFTGGGVHTNTLAAMNVGSNLYGGAYVYGTLSLGSTSDQIQFLNGGGGGDALYVRNLDLFGDTNNIANLFAPTGITVYYLGGEHNTFNNYLQGETYVLNGGGLLAAAIPEPGTLAFVGLAMGLLVRRFRRR